MRKNDARILGMNILCAAVMLPLAESAWSAMNKCTGADGKVSYTEQPCEQNQTKATVNITVAPPSAGEGSGSHKDHAHSSRQAAQCERARKLLEIGKRAAAQESNKNKGDLLVTLKQDIANLEQNIREQCN